MKGVLIENEIILFEDQGVKLEVNMKDETVWLTQAQMSELFKKAKSTINEHIKKIYETGELIEGETMTKFGNSEFSDKPTNYYNLDMILSVGYRVNSKRGILFRKWANQVLKDHLIKGYSVNETRMNDLKKTVQLLDVASRVNSNSSEISDIIRVIHDYSISLGLLDDYDHRCLEKKRGHTSEEMITYEQCIYIIDSLKSHFDSDIFALERNHGLKSIISNIYQTYEGEDVYKSVEEKCANFFYMIIKNHVFIDGNKRIAATLFIYILFFYDLLYNDNTKVIDNHTLVALTLLIAESNPKEKEIFIDLIVNLLCE